MMIWIKSNAQIQEDVVQWLYCYIGSSAEATKAEAKLSPIKKLTLKPLTFGPPDSHAVIGHDNNKGSSLAEVSTAMAVA